MQSLRGLPKHDTSIAQMKRLAHKGRLPGFLMTIGEPVIPRCRL
ncbi:conserved hypothetical protein [Roseibium sp. TrichSKD4]|nr:conserved hypothetical protein [Roseibium sp. TrichSKD4]